MSDHDHRRDIRIVTAAAAVVMYLWWMLAHPGAADYMVLVATTLTLLVIAQV